MSFINACMAISSVDQEDYVSQIVDFLDTRALHVTMMLHASKS